MNASGFPLEIPTIEIYIHKLIKFSNCVRQRHYLNNFGLEKVYILIQNWCAICSIEYKTIDSWIEFKLVHYLRTQN